MSKNKLSSINKTSKRNLLAAVAVAVAVGIVGFTLYSTLAAGVVANIEAEQGTVSGNASKVADENASGGSFLQFGLASDGPPGDGGGDCTHEGSNQPIPGDDVPGWNLLVSDDFCKDAPVGSWGTKDPHEVVYTGSTGTRWTTYPDGWPCTAGYTNCHEGAYRPADVLSVKNGALYFYLHSIDGRPVGANPSPLLNGDSKDQTYGRYTFRFKIDTPGLNEWHLAWLLWPQSNNGNCGGGGEEDFPEGSAGGEIGGFHHHQINGCNQDAVGSTGEYFTEWHTYTLEWTPDRVRYILDGEEVLNSTAGISHVPMHWQLQTEVNGHSSGKSGNLILDWIAVYEYAG